MSLEQPPTQPPTQLTPPTRTVWQQLPAERRQQLTALLATLLQRQLHQAHAQAQPLLPPAVAHE